MSDTPTPITDELAREFAGKRVSSREAGAVWNLCRDLERELEEARKQRDTLAEALASLLSGVKDGWFNDGKWWHTGIEQAEQALAATKGVSHE